jgi:1,4-dihydroxy-2-naphthoate octaprenyltransferase
MRTLKLFIQLSRPLFLLGGFLFYALGAGIARYLGQPIDWGVYLLGQAWGTLLQLSTHYLNEYFDAPADIDNPNRTPFTGGSGALGPGKLPRATALWAGIGCLAGVGSLTAMLMATGALNPAALLVMLLIFLGAFFYAVPPVRLEATGYGELTTSILVANLVPAFSLLLQTGEFHRLLTMATFPLTMLILALFIVARLHRYSQDVKFGKQNLLVRLGWKLGMKLHNFLILSSFILLSLAMGLGLPFRIALPVFLALPLGLLQIWLIHRITNGAKPNWLIMKTISQSLVGLYAYFLVYGFWIG